MEKYIVKLTEDERIALLASFKKAALTPAPYPHKKFFNSDQLFAEGWKDGVTAVKVMTVAYYLPSSSLAAEYH
jgi:hypothetical protein